MLRRVFLAAIASVVAPWLLTVTPVAASVSGCPSGKTSISVGTGVICTSVHEDGNPPNSKPSSAAGAGQQQSPGCQKADGTAVPCTTPDGTWWAGYQCYAAPDHAPPGTPAWQGHTDGSLWQCTSCSVGSTCNVQTIWVAPGQPAAPPDPGTLAKNAVGQMQLGTAEIHVAPAYPDPTYVGVENWLWIPSGQWSALTKSTTAGSTTVSVAATPVEVVWHMGPGIATCDGPGMPWTAGMTDAATTACGFTYKQASQGQPNDVFKISATIRYHITWTCTGSCTATSGDLGLSDGPAGAGQMTVLQRQTVVVQ